MMNKFINIIAIIFCIPLFTIAQNSQYSLNDCINYAYKSSTDIIRANNNVTQQNAYIEQSKAARLPNLFIGTTSQLNSTNSYNSDFDQWERNSRTSLNASLSSQMTLYNGAILKNTIRQDKINLDAAKIEVQTEKEIIALNILSVYIDVLLAKENLQNSKLQLEALQKQYFYAEARKEAGAISLSDLLYIKSQMASNKTAFKEAESALRIALVNLMQLMNMPTNNNFDVKMPDIDKIINDSVETNSLKVYQIALGIQPNIKTAELNLKSSELDINIAKANALPKLTLSGAINSNFNSMYNGINMSEQLSKGINPYIGLNLSVPIFQQKQTKTKIKLAQIQLSNSELELIDMKNNLRKYIEQACIDAQVAQTNYQALQDQLIAEKESYKVALEMFSQGIINSVDFLISKNNLIVSENKFTQAKYNLILQYKIVEYYLGKNISL